MKDKNKMVAIFPRVAKEFFFINHFILYEASTVSLFCMPLLLNPIESELESVETCLECEVSRLVFIIEIEIIAAPKRQKKIPGASLLSFIEKF